MVLFLFLAHLAIGIAFTLVFVSREAGVKFFRFNTGLAALLMVGAFAFRPAEASAAAAGFPSQVMTILSFFSSALLLGGTCTAMILGHWYLVIPSLQVSHLQSIVKVHIASMVARVAVVAAAVFMGL